MDTSAGVDAWAALLRVHATVVPRLAKELAATGLALAWYDVLLELNAAPGRRLRMSRLGDLAVLSRERVSRVVAELEAAGLVTRERDLDDKRSWFAQITPEGRARLRKAAPTYLAGIETHFASHLSDAEIAVLTKALGRVLTAAPAPAVRGCLARRSPVATAFLRGFAARTDEGKGMVRDPSGDAAVVAAARPVNARRQ